MKRDASISIILLFVFLLISLSFLFLFSQLEQRILIEQTIFDAIQSGYIAESTAYQYLNELDFKNYFEKLRRPGKREELPIHSVLDGETLEANLRTIEEKDQFNSYELQIVTSYREIRSEARVYGHWINPIFYQRDGYLLKDEINEEELINAILENFENSEIIFKKVLNVADPSQMTFEMGEFSLSPLDVIDDPVSTHRLNALPCAIGVADYLRINNQGTFQGLVRIREGATVEGDFSLNGILILEPGSRTYGKINVYGLCIDLGGDSSGVHSIFSKEESIKYLRALDGFIDPQVISLEKI